MDLRPVTDADAIDAVPAFRATVTASNVGFYERRGYRVIAQCDVPDSPVHVWGMRFN